MKDNFLKKRKGTSYLEGNVVYLVFLLVFVVLAMVFLLRYENGAWFWEQYYSYNIARAINQADSGGEFVLDMDHAVEIARKNGLKEFENLVLIDSEKQEVKVSLQEGKYTIYPYTKNVKVLSAKLSDSPRGYKLSIVIEERK